MNLRIAQGLYDDEWLTESKFDPEENTSRLIAALDTYKSHGILAINVSLQAGNAGYNKKFPGIKRESEAKFGAGRGALTSAFRPDGSLKEAWLKRLLRLGKELDRREMILDLMYFYQGQDEVLENPEAIDRGTRTATDWLIDHDCRNVIIEIANEFNVARYDHGQYIIHQMGHQIETARERFEAKDAHFRLPISASASRLQLFDGVRGHADLTIIHGNNKTLEDKRKKMAELFVDPTAPGPILMNEDDNGRETTVETLRKELESCDIVFAGGGSWGFMPWRMVPANSLAVGGPCLALRGEVYMFYAEAASIIVNLSGLEGGGITADWYDTWTGYREKASAIYPGVLKLKKPESIGKAPAVLIVRRTS